jgi:hypothetical protein
MIKEFKNQAVLRNPLAAEVDVQKQDPLAAELHCPG